MGSSGCVNGNYSAPVPVIGLYIAATSSVCLLFMLIDILSAFRHRQRWIPCRLFSLNSITLTLLSICSKLPVDLTTAMPSLEDQLSKLTGTTVVCIAIGFVSPSVGNNKDSEYVSNMAALSVLVITVVVNICIQISTGVIHKFVIEHITIMSCMLILLLLLWYSGSDVQVNNQYYFEENRQRINETQGSMLDRLKICYLYAFDYNPQLKTCRSVINCTIAGVCLICFCVLIQATVRSVIMKQLQFCEGVSDYDWSMWIIVVSQILVVILGCSASSFRLFTLFSQVEFEINDVDYEEDDADYLARTHPLMRAPLWHRCRLHIRNYVWYILWIPIILILMPATVLFKIVLRDRRYMYRQDSSDNADNAVQELKQLVREHTDRLPNEWTLRKVANNIKTWVDVSKTGPPKNLQQLLARTHPSHKLHAMEFKDLFYPDQRGIEVSSFAMALLVKLATFSMPGNLAKSLVDSFEEAYEILHFIETRINSAGGPQSRLKIKLTKAVLLGDGFHVYLPNIIRTSSYSAAEFHSLSPLSRALVILKELSKSIGWGIEISVEAITNLINRRQDYETVEEVYYCMEQIFVDMLHLILAQFPNAIYKQVGESSAEEFEERARIALKLWCKMKWLEDHVLWAPASTVTPQVLDTTQSTAEIVNSIHDLEVGSQVEQK